MVIGARLRTNERRPSTYGIWLLITSGIVSLACATPRPSSEDEVPPLQCSLSALDQYKPLDIAFAFDNSLSSQKPSGIDVDGDGVVGTLSWSVFSDPDDSWLGAQVAAARRLIEDASEYDIRFSIVTFAGMPFLSHRTRNSRAVRHSDARTLMDFGDAPAKVDRVFDRVLREGSFGSANFYGGLRRSNESLIEAGGTQDAEIERRRLVLLISDTAGPVVLENGKPLENAIDPKVAVAVREANRHEIAIHTFGLTKDSPDWTRLPIGLVATMTDGAYHAVEDAAELYCHFVDTIVRESNSDD